MIKQSLNDHWTVRAVPNQSQIPTAVRDVTVPARVPGCIHTDLLRAGLIEDSYFGLNEPKLLWIGESDWQYTTYFDADPKLFDHERIDLVCDGLDTVATIILNSTEVARTQNMHRGYRFDVRPMLKKGRNELTILFASPVKYALAMRDKLGHLPAIICGGPFNFIRKMACNFGWDWGPVVPTCGIWKGVRLEAFDSDRITNVRPCVTFDGTGAAWVEVQIDTLHAYQDRELYGTLKGPDGSEFHTSYGDDSVTHTAKGAVLRFSVPKPQKWWPIGHGNQSVYDLYVVLMRGDQHPHLLESRLLHIGLRTVELDTSPDDIGRKFVVKVNGKPIFCKGFNWIPDDCFLDRACEPGRVRKRIQQALDANANMLRVWGGGIYETDDFYDICDEKGMLVWQDFLFACAAYPEEDPIKSEVEAEARYNVARLAHHPSLVLWNGCNENLWGFHEWSTEDENGVKTPWKEQLKGKKWGPGYYLDLLPKIVKEVDPSRPYWAASPWSGDPDVEHGIHPNAETHGNKHIWEVWHGPGDYSNYRRFSPRFCSEFGYQGPANYSTMVKYFDDSLPLPPGEGRGEGALENRRPLDIGHPLTLALSRGERGPEGEPRRVRDHWAGWLAMHQKSPGGNERNDRLLAKDFNIPENFDDWHYLLQLNQARALQTGVEWFRSRQPRCMGTLYWQLNDCYPVISWSAIDSEGRLKPLWYATRRFYAPRLLTIQPENDSLVLYANNDNDDPWQCNLQIRRINFSGKELAKLNLPIEVAPRTNLCAFVLSKEISTPVDPSRELIIADTEDRRALWFFKSDRELNYPVPKFKSALHRLNDEWRLTITAESLLRDVVLDIDRVDPEATISDNVVTFLPGEVREFILKCSKDVTVAQLTEPPVFQCANRFGKR